MTYFCFSILSFVYQMRLIRFVHKQIEFSFCKSYFVVLLDKDFYCNFLNVKIDKCKVKRKTSLCGLLQCLRNQQITFENIDLQIQNSDIKESQLRKILNENDASTYELKCDNNDIQILVQSIDEEGIQKIANLDDHKQNISNSLILSLEEKECLLSYLPKGNQSKLSLLYHSSLDGFKTSVFHRKCDKQGHTVTIILNEKQQVFGGYTNVSWGTSNGYSRDECVFLFSLRNPKSISKQKFTIIADQANFATFNSKNHGPTFGKKKIQRL
ncbi:hypothetical protein RFI_02734 [Reticulomyxa filosa]|uniref:TLDc domain-containing protein n=1 Tax=Reticulomyxa filosa TaxID=46433 RepID=X6P742_RETFI|nr:hypothetical protein RFI_02734 [Reticulomyxa filosa]|eukprot:ETO34360.1 hypothetical protein RFI_02734 [Reticulomyxa filosa]